MKRWCLMVLTGCLLATGCAGLRGGEADPGTEVPGEAPALSLSMTRGVSVTPVESADAADSQPIEEAVLEESGTPVYTYRLQTGDPVMIHLRGIYPRDEQIEDIIDDAGNVTLPFLGDIPAVGKSTSQLESDIRTMYIEGGYYRTITVSVIMPQRTYFIRGEVRQPGRYPIVGGLTLMQAIAAAGGYTEFASQRSVQLIRGVGKPMEINMKRIERNPENDIRLESGDVIVVNRSIF